ncbi:MAG: ATP-binding protein [Thermodesulfobacteriota bacterium]
MTLPALTEILNSTAVTIAPESPVQEGLSLMETQGVTALVVARENKPIGIFSERDALLFYRSGQNPTTVSIDQVMSQSPVIITSEMDHWQIFRLITEQRLQYVIAVGIEGKLDGIISTETLFPHLVRLLKEKERTRETQAYQKKIITFNNQIANILLTSSKSVVYSEVLDLVMENLDSEFGYIGYINEFGELVCPSMTRNIWDQCQIEDKSIVFPPSVWGGIWGKSLEQGKTVVANEGLRLPKGHVSLKNSIAVPIIHRQQLIGQMVLANREGGYGFREQALLEGVADQVAPVLSGMLREERQKQVQERLEDQYRQSQKMEAIGTLAGGIAHDFNNILSGIMAYAGLIQDEVSEGSPVGQDITEILAAGERASKLIGQILTFSQKKKIIKRPVQPEPIVKEAMNLLRATLPTTIKIEEDIDPDCGMIMADPTNIHQVVINLCTNGLHAMDNEKGTLTVSLKRLKLDAREARKTSGSYVALTVKDTGCGINPDDIDRIFDPYFTTQTAETGTGLGLAVIHGIIQEAQGFIKVESEPGDGSTFVVYIPALDEREKAEEKRPRRSRLQSGNGHILVVDDEEFLVRVTKRQLEKLGYRVSATIDSKEALEMFQSDPDQFDLLVTDQAMPELSGAELALAVKAVRPNFPIILCTGYSNVLSKARCRAMGIDKYIIKPVIRNELSGAIRKLLDKK